MTISGVRAVFVAALAAMLSLYPAMSQQGPGHPMATPPKPITAPHRSPAQLSVLSAAVSDVTPSLNSASWTAIGPAALDSTDPLSGRITGVAVDPTASTTIYVGAAGGGVWKTTDGGTTWTPLTDTQPDLAIGAIAVAPTNNLRIYAGTGEANNSLDSNRGVGILVSSDGGTTWTLNSASGALTGTAVGQIAVDPTNADIAYAAVGGYGFNNNYSVNEGIWKTTNGGTTWTNVTAAASLPATVDWSSVVVDPNTPAIIYAAMGDYVGGASNGVYRSTNSGSTWALLANAPNGTDANLGRIALAVSPAAATVGAHVLYVASAQSSGNYGIGYFERSDNADAATPTFTNLTSTTPDFLGGENLPGEGWYAIALNVDANGNVYCAGEQNNIDGTDEIIWSSNLGVGWTDISIENTFEPPYSEHAIAFDSSNNMILGGDGGIYSYNATTPGWTDLNGDLNTIQFQGIGLHPTNSGTVIGGSQGNGTELYSGSLVWTQVRGADGGPAKISQSNGSVCYHEYNGPSLEISTDSCATWTPANAGIISSVTYATGSPNYYDTYTLDPTNGDHVVFGTDYVNESTDGGTTWTVIGTSGTNNYNPSDLPVDSVALSPTNGANPEVVYAATGGTFATTSQIFVAQGPNGTSTAWTEADLPTCAQNGGTSTGCRVHQIVTDPNDKTGGTAFAVTNDFSSGAGGHVFRTVNKGGAWTDVSSSLPNEPVWSIQVDTDPNKTAYISTDAGVYSSPSPYSAWTLIGTGLPNAQGYDLELNSTLNILGVGTHGRGAWEIETPAHVKSVSSTDSNGTYTTGSVIPITMTFSNTVTVTGTPQLALNTSPAATASYVSGSGTVTLTFNYTVVSGQTTIGNATGGNLDYASSGALSLNGGTINDASSTAAELTLYAPGGAGSLSANKSIVIGLPTPPALTTPAPGSTLSGAAVTFHWSAGVGSTGFSFVAGTTGTGSYNLYNSGVTTALSAAVTGIPTTGATLYVRLGYRAAAGWKYIDYTYTEAGGTPAPPVLTTPAPGSMLSGSAVTFGWSAGVGSTGFSFVAGTTGTGSYNLYNSGVTTALTAPVTGIPTAGATLYVRLGYRAPAGCRWNPNALLSRNSFMQTYTTRLLRIRNMRALKR